MVVATKYLVLALTFILSASQPGISPAQKTELLNQAAINVAKVIPAYIEEQNNLANAIASSTNTVAPVFGTVQEVAPQDTQIISEINNQAMVDAQQKQLKLDNAKAKKDTWNATRKRMADNQAAVAEIERQKATLGTGISAGQGNAFNLQERALQEEYEKVLLPLYQSQAAEAIQAEKDAQ